MLPIYRSVSARMKLSTVTGAALVDCASAPLIEPSITVNAQQVCLVVMDQLLRSSSPVAARRASLSVFGSLFSPSAAAGGLFELDDVRQPPRLVEENLGRRVSAEHDLECAARLGRHPV